jgi:hypothetical protein
MKYVKPREYVDIKLKVKKMTEKEEYNKYVHLENGSDYSQWHFIKDDDELEEYKKDGSLEDGEYIIEIAKIFKINEIVKTTIELIDITKKKP